MIGDDELAVLVRALTFQLIDPVSGAVAGELISGTDAAMFPPPLPATFDGLEMYHRDPFTTDSSLRWTHDGAGEEVVQLTGPASSGASTAQRPHLLLSRTALGNMVTELAAGDPTGGTFPDRARLRLAREVGKFYSELDAGQSSLSLTDDVGIGGGSQLFSAVAMGVGALGLLKITGYGGLALRSDAPAIAETNFSTPRGLIYGVSRHETSMSGANVASTVAASVLLAIVLPNCPTATFADVSFVSNWLCQVAPANSLNLQIRINGVLQTPLAYTQNNANTQSGCFAVRKTFAMPIGVNTIELVEYGGAATYAILGADQTILTAVLYR